MSKSNSKRKHESEAALASKVLKSGAKPPVSCETAIDAAQKALEREFDASSVSDYYNSWSDAVSAVLSTNSRAHEWFPKPIAGLIVCYTQTAPSALEEVIRTKQDRCGNAVRWYFRYLSSVTVLSNVHVDQLPLMRGFMDAHSTGALMVITDSLVKRPQVKSPSECTLVVEVHRLINGSHVHCRMLYQWLLNTNSYAVMPRLSDDIMRDNVLTVDFMNVMKCLKRNVGVAAFVRLYAIARTCMDEFADDYPAALHTYNASHTPYDPEVSEYVGTHFSLDDFMQTAEAEQLQDVLCEILQFVADQAVFVQLEQRIRALTINAQNVIFWRKVWSVIIPDDMGAAVALSIKLDEYEANRT